MAFDLLQSYQSLIIFMMLMRLTVDIYCIYQCGSHAAYDVISLIHLDDTFTCPGTTRIVSDEIHFADYKVSSAIVAMSLGHWKYLSVPYVEVTASCRIGLFSSVSLRLLTHRCLRSKSKFRHHLHPSPSQSINSSIGPVNLSPSEASSLLSRSCNCSQSLPGRCQTISSNVMKCSWGVGKVLNDKITVNGMV